MDYLGQYLSCWSGFITFILKLSLTPNTSPHCIIMLLQWRENMSKVAYKLLGQVSVGLHWPLVESTIWARAYFIYEGLFSNSLTAPFFPPRQPFLDLYRWRSHRPLLLSHLVPSSICLYYSVSLPSTIFVACSFTAVAVFFFYHLSTSLPLH